MSRGLILPSVVAVGVLLVGSVGGLLDAPPATPSVGVPLTLDPSRVLDLARSGSFALDLPVGRVAFDVRPNPIAEGAVVGLDGVPVDRVTETVTFEGTANGFPARLAATRAGVFALVLAPDPVLVEPAWVSQPGAPASQHRVVLWSQAPAVIAPHPEPEAVASNSVESLPPPVLPSGPANRTVHFLVEGDNQFYQKATLFGACPDCWVEVQQAIFNLAELLFERQTGVHFEITSQWACTTVAGCPYAGLGIGSWLEAFRDRWETIITEPPHELGHLLSGTNLNLGDGIAYEGSVNTPNGYALSEALASPTGGVNFSPLSVHYLAAHEIGHNFNATHAEADVFVPAPNQQLSFLSVATLMRPNAQAKFQFSDGFLDPSHNNVARIVAHALQQLPPG